MKRGCYSQVLVCVGSKFVMASPDVLNERVGGYDDRGGSVAFESAHWSKPRLQPTVIGFDSVVGVLLGVVERIGNLYLNCCLQRLGKIGDHFVEFAVSGKCRSKEGSGRFDVSRF